MKRWLLILIIALPFLGDASASSLTAKDIIIKSGKQMR